MQQHSDKGKPAKKDPDRGHPMMEGEMKFDKGYVSDSETFSPDEGATDDHYRGNKYFEMRNEALRRDDKKLKRSKFSKFA